jgi:hypothetical protein
MEELLVGVIPKPPPSHCDKGRHIESDLKLVGGGQATYAFLIIRKLML